MGLTVPTNPIAAVCDAVDLLSEGLPGGVRPPLLVAPECARVKLNNISPTAATPHLANPLIQLYGAIDGHPIVFGLRGAEPGWVVYRAMSDLPLEQCTDRAKLVKSFRANPNYLMPLQRLLRECSSTGITAQVVFCREDPAAPYGEGAHRIPVVCDGVDGFVEIVFAKSSLGKKITYDDAVYELLGEYYRILEIQERAVLHDQNASTAKLHGECLFDGHVVFRCLEDLEKFLIAHRVKADTLEDYEIRCFAGSYASPLESVVLEIEEAAGDETVCIPGDDTRLLGSSFAGHGLEIRSSANGYCLKGGSEWLRSALLLTSDVQRSGGARVVNSAVANLKLLSDTPGVFKFDLSKELATGLGLASDNKMSLWQAAAGKLRSILKSDATPPVSHRRASFDEIAAQQVGQPVFEINRKCIVDGAAYSCLMRIQPMGKGNQAIVPIRFDETGVLFHSPGAHSLRVEIVFFPQCYSNDCTATSVRAEQFISKVKSIYDALISANRP